MGLIRSQYPPPETADELCAVAQSTGASETTVHLGDKATDKTVKGLSAGGVLANARIVHFATHGLLASESGMVNARAEPALILTLPPAAERGRRRAAHRVRGGSPQARCGLGGPVGLKHGAR